MKPILVLHGGAGRAASPKRRALVRERLLGVLRLAHPRLSEGAVEAAAFATRLLEDDPEFNAGTGSRLQADGAARLSAAIMDGARLRFAGVVNLERVKNPVLVARSLLEKEYRVLAAEGAEAYARSIGVESYDPRTEDAVRRWRAGSGRGSDTVGACALDAQGGLAASTSTGGRGFETPGRVSDSPTVAGTYADAYAAVSATGTGEEIVDEGLAVKLVTRGSDGADLAGAFARTFLELSRRGHDAGAIGLDREGRVSVGKSSELLYWAWTDGERVESFE